MLAEVLLGFPARRTISIQRYDSGPTSNDLLESLVAGNTATAVNYQVVAQCAEEIENIENAPAVSMRPYLIKSGQKNLLTTISIYSLPGESADQKRFLYMNPEAIRVWEEMGKAPRIIGAQVRPPRAALLTLGIPFSE